MLMPGYDAPKAAHVAAFFALKSGSRINVLKLAKLLYLTERESMARYDEPMFYDRLVSMPDGPVTSITLNLINGNLESPDWTRVISPRKGYDVCAKPDFDSIDKLDELSRSDLEILDYLWGKFGPYDKYQIRDFTHVKDNIPEWTDPQGSSLPISHEVVFGFLDKKDSEGLAEAVESYRRQKQYLMSE